MTRLPSRERGCTGKVNLGSKHYKKTANKLANKYGKNYAVYRCPYCLGTHLTTKTVDGTYAEVLYQTSQETIYD